MADRTSYQIMSYPTVVAYSSSVPARTGFYAALVVPQQSFGSLRTIEMRTGFPFAIGESVFTGGAVTLRKLRGWNTISLGYSYWTEGAAIPDGVDLTSITAVGIA